MTSGNGRMSPSHEVTGAAGIEGDADQIRPQAGPSVKKVDGNASGDWRVRLARRGRPARIARFRDK